MYVIYICILDALTRSLSLCNCNTTNPQECQHDVLRLRCSLSLCPSLVAVVLVLRCCCVIVVVVVGADFLALAVSLALTDCLVAHSTEKRLRSENSQHTKKNAGSRTHEYVAHLCVCVCVWYTKTEREEKNVASWFFNTSAQLAPSKTHNCNTNEASRGRRSRRRHNTQFEI